MIELCASLFDWARFRQTKGAVKLHLLLDHDGYLPVFAHVTDGKVHEVKVAQALTFPPGSIVAIDKGYLDYDLFWRWNQGGVFFATRQKDNADFRVSEEKPLPRRRSILRDQVIERAGFYSQRKYPGRHEAAVSLGRGERKDHCASDQSPDVRRDDGCRIVQGPMADRDLFQNDQTESEDQDLRGNLSERTFDPDLDSIDRRPDPEVSKVPVPVPVVAVEYGGDAALQPVHLQEFMDVGGPTL